LVPQGPAPLTYHSCSPVSSKNAIYDPRPIDWSRVRPPHSLSSVLSRSFWHISTPGNPGPSPTTTPSDESVCHSWLPRAALTCPPSYAAVRLRMGTAAREAGTCSPPVDLGKRAAGLSLARSQPKRQAKEKQAPCHRRQLQRGGKGVRYAAGAGSGTEAGQLDTPPPARRSMANN